MRRDPKYLGIPNINFSCKECKTHKKQRKARGFDDSETYSLEVTIAQFIVPRLERYIELADGWIERPKEQIEATDKFLNAMRIIARDDHSLENQKEVQDGLDCFPSLFQTLWW